MNGLMMQQPLLISSLLVHAERHHGEQEVVSRRVEGDIHRTTYRELAARSRRMANALARLGVQERRPGRHAGLERLPPPRGLLRRLGLAARCCTRSTRACIPTSSLYIADHAEDQVLFFDLTFLPLVEAVASRVKTVKHFVAHDRPRAHAGGEQDPRTCSATRTWSRPRTTASSGRASTRTRRRRSATPRAPPATRRARSTATARRCCTPSRSPCPTRSNCSAARRDPAGGADVPRQRLGPAVRRLHDRREAGLPGPGPRRQVALRAVREPRASRSRPACRRSGRACSATSRPTTCASRPCAAPSSAARPARRR